MNLYSDQNQAVDEILRQLGNEIVLGAPLGAGKPNHLINALYKRAKKDSTLKLTICTALTLQKPRGKSLLEERFLSLFRERVFGDYPDLEYEEDRLKGTLPENIKVIEFYFPPGKYLRNPTVQQDYISTNYTHVCRDMMDRKINLLVQMVAKRDQTCSLSSNADVTGDMAMHMRNADYPTLIVGQVNNHLPYMYGDALMPQEDFDILIDNPDYEYKIFGPPKMSVSSPDYMIGLYAASLVRDDGELQVGIGSLGDAVIYALTLRQKYNEVFQRLFTSLKIEEKFSEAYSKLGDKEVFKEGLFGATEMMVDGFMQLYKCGILCKKTYDNLAIQRLINEDVLDPTNIRRDILPYLIKNNLIEYPLTYEACEKLKYWGFLKEDFHFTSDKNNIENFIGSELKNGHLMHAGFFLGPQEFYKWLRELSDEERKLFPMRSVLKINQLYGHEDIDRLHRKNARFINTCMMTTLFGAHVSDGLEDGRVVSGVGGQYNFVAMAQELPDGHSLITMRATRKSKGKVLSNIVFNYGHITIPRHLRDILITEYGIAYLRGKTDEEIIIELLKVCDSRFQEDLMAQAKAAGKLSESYTLPEIYKNNYPNAYESLLAEYRHNGLFSPFPFGTDLTEDEIHIGGALKRLKSRSDAGLLSKSKLILEALFTFPKADQQKYLEMMKLDSPASLKERFLRKLLVTEL